MASLPTVNAIWIGPELGPLHTACLSSFLHHGHRVVLHCYECPKDAPRGVVIADANELLSKDRIIRHRKSGSPSLFTNFLRYEILGANLYVDCDVFCIRPIADADYIFGWESRGSINGAILKLPPDCPTLAALRAIKDTPNYLPPWEKRSKRRFAWLRGPDRTVPLEDLPWGSVGPKALTYYAKLHGIDRFASPIDRFYPVHWQHVGQFFDPALTLSDLTTYRTDALHLYYSNFRFHSRDELFPTSVIGRLIEDGKIKEVASADRS
jgi:hypothetical protein